MLGALGNYLAEKSNTMARERFTQAENQWDLENLYADLASVKGKNLTPMEKLHLRGLLCGCSPTEMAEKLHKNLRGLEVDLSKSVYHYVKDLVNRSEEKVENWRNICQWLEEEGYKTQQPIQSQSENSIPVDAKVNISNTSVEGNKFKVGVLLQFTFPLPPDSDSKDNPTQ